MSVAVEEQKQSPSLAELFAGVKAGLKARAPQEVIDTLNSVVVRLKATGQAGRSLEVGQTMPEFALPDANGHVVKSADLLAKGPMVLAFYRGGWCPYCNLQLKALQNVLPQMTAKGVTLVAVSPQLPDGSLSTAEKNGLAFPVLSDVGNVLARKLGLVFQLDEKVKAISLQFGNDLAKVNGDDRYELPIPATYLVSKAGVVQKRFVDEDYTTRLEPAELLRWIDEA